MCQRSAAAIQAHAPRAHGTSRTANICVPLVTASASNFAEIAQTLARAGRRGSHAGYGATLCPPRHTGLGPRLCSAVSHRWLSGVSDGPADPLWALGAARAH